MTSASLVPSDTVEPALQNIWILLNKNCFIRIKEIEIKHI